MKQTFEYKGYLGSAELSLEDNLLVGRLLFIRDVISYVAESPRDLEVAFREAVDDYLATCEELGDQPDVPCKGGLNIRIGPDRHRAAAIAALQEASTLNDWICRAIDSYLVVETPANVTNHLTVNLYGHSQEHQVATSAGIPAGWSTFTASAAGTLQH